MRTDAVRLGGLSAIASLVAGGAAVAFERASADVLTASPAEFTEWVQRYRTELLTQSLFFVVSSALLLVFLVGLHAHLRWAAPDLAVTAFAAGALWVGMSLTAQSMQVAMARAASDGGAIQVVAALGDLMTVLLLVANLPLVVLLVAAAVAGLRRHGLPSWLGWLSALAALAHLLPVLGVVAEDGPMSPDGFVGYLPYPFFVAWLVATAVVMLRAPARTVPAPAARESVTLGGTP